jgi:hypothetical protein
MSDPSLTTSTNLRLVVDRAATSNAYSNLTCTSSSQRLDAQIKGLISCEFCPETFTTRGRYKYGSLFFSESSFGLTIFILVVIVKLILFHTAVTVVKGLH